MGKQAFKKKRECRTIGIYKKKSPSSKYSCTFHSPAEAMFVCRGVFLQQSSELQQGELLEQIHLQHRLAANLELGRGQAWPMGVLEARPAEFLWPGARREKRRRESTN